MAKKIRVPKTVAKILHAASNVRSRGEIHWSNSKGKFVKANNRTIADESQVHRYLEQHPDQTTWERAITHLGPGVPRPPAMLPEVSSTAQADVAKLEELINEYKAGNDRVSQAMLDQQQKVLDGLAPVPQLLDTVQQLRSSLEQSDQKHAAEISGIRDDIRQLQDHFQELKDKFGQTDEALAQAIAFDPDLIARLERIQQQLDNLQGLREEIQHMQSEGVFNHTLIQAVDSPGIGEIVFLTIAALLVGIVVTAYAVRDGGQWLSIPDIVWGVLALTIAFLFFYVISWSIAERNVRVRVGGGS